MSWWHCNKERFLRYQRMSLLLKQVWRGGYYYRGREVTMGDHPVEVRSGGEATTTEGGEVTMGDHPVKGKSVGEANTEVSEGVVGTIGDDPINEGREGSIEGDPVPREMEGKEKTQT